ncbi:unnamed protein product [Rangifer tarandus platyrhynchus]|uniref:Uncharacterized protein n=2 Tax=Rangifer tarandus platyrhynchus TaxID=3082113 RepID=A0AC59Z8G9_RANTA|nr:unnamed protein product [Rangifer tarandus platyrhynchus]
MEKGIPFMEKNFLKAGIAILVSDEWALNKDCYKRQRRTLHNDEGINPRRRQQIHMHPAPQYIRQIQMALVVKNLPANAGDLRDEGWIPGSGRSPGEGNGNPLQRIPWTEEPGRLQSVESQRVRHS